jgi:hypothetical protein
MQKTTDAPIQHWVTQMSGIYSKCSCGTHCSYDKGHGFDLYSEHYDYFEISTKKPKHKSEGWDEAFALVNANPEKYKVSDFSEEPIKINQKRPRNKNEIKHI